MTTKGLLVLLLVSFCALATSAAAQETAGTIVGTVTDQTGAVVPGVTVAAKNLTTGRTYEAVSNSAGAFMLQLLPVGEYEVVFQLTGFQPFTAKGISLHVSDRLEVNGKLSVGGVAEVIEVTATQQLVQPMAALQTLIDSKQVQELPLNNRNFVQLATLAPGVSSDLSDEVGIGLTSTVSISVNGSRRNSVNWLVDGVSNVDVGSNITLLSTPTLDSIQEFKIITNGYAAEWPRSGGGVVNVVTKSGTAKYHGSGYYFGRSDKLNANSFIRNRSTDPAIAGHPPKLNYKNFGYTAGGPVPGLNKKLFFFWSQEWRDISRAPASLTATVPDPAWLTDPTSTNYVAPALRDANAVKLLAAWPAPNVAGKNQYIVSSPALQKTRQEVIRMDYDLSPKWRLTGRFTNDWTQTMELGGLFLGIAVPNVGTTLTDAPGVVFSLSLKTIASNNALNEFSYQRSGNRIESNNPQGTLGTRSDYGINIPEIWPENLTNRIPTVAISGLSSIASSQLYRIHYVNHSFTDNFSYQRGTHAFKAGLLMTFEQKNENAAGNSQGSFNFQSGGGRTAFQNFLTGNADGLCTGTFCTYAESERDITMHLRFNRYEMYAQDSWKPRPNLTLDMGLRYSLYPPVTDTNNMLATFSPAAYKGTAPAYANAAGSTITLGSGDLLDGIIIAGRNSPYGDAIYAYKKNSFQPRVGFSWSPRSDGDTILRGAFGIYYDQPLVGIFEQDSFTTPPIVNNASIQAARLSTPTAGTTPTTAGVRTLTASATDFANPRTMQWNLTMTRRLFKTGVIEISYVGARGDNLIRPTNINFPQPADVVALQTTVAGAVNPVRPYRSYGDITMRETTAISRYNGLLTSFRWQPARAAAVTINYTLSRSRTDASNDRDAIDIPQNPANPAAEYADARTDRRHILSASYMYELPFFRDAKNAVLRMTLGGWQIAGLTMINSGQPMPRISVLNNSNRRGGFADFTPGQAVLAGQLDQWGTPNMWFNPNAFQPPADGTFGNSGRAPFRQPGFHRTDLTLSKNIYLPHNVRLQFRADMINAFNVVNWASDPSATGLDNTCTTSTTSCTVATDTFGQLIAVRLAREIQLGLKLSW